MRPRALLAEGGAPGATQRSMVAWDINSSSSEDESGPSGDDDRMQQQQGGAQPEQPAASDAVETLVISF